MGGLLRPLYLEQVALRLSEVLMRGYRAHTKPPPPKTLQWHMPRAMWCS